MEEMAFKNERDMLYAHESGRGPLPERRDFVWAPYDGLHQTPYRKETAILANIRNCSLPQYIGVEWCTRIPDEKKVGYMTKIFTTLAEAGNEEATASAFHVLREIYVSTEFYRRCEKLYAVLLQGPCKKIFFSRYKDSVHPYYPHHKLVDVVRRELRHELLMFIQKNLWVIPYHCDANAQKTTHIETRKKMLAVCGEEWRGIPCDVNDELAFTILCTAAIGHTQHRPSAKELNDALQQVLRDALNRIHADSEPEIDWKYWMTRPEHPELVEIVLNVFAKTRSAIGGYKYAIADIKAREQVATLKNL